jgi:hypothetical protein
MIGSAKGRRKYDHETGGCLVSVTRTQNSGRVANPSTMSAPNQALLSIPRLLHFERFFFFFFGFAILIGLLSWAASFGDSDLPSNFASRQKFSV